MASDADYNAYQQQQQQRNINRISSRPVVLPGIDAAETGLNLEEQHSLATSSGPNSNSGANIVITSVPHQQLPPIRPPSFPPPPPLLSVNNPVVYQSLMRTQQPQQQQVVIDQDESSNFFPAYASSTLRYQAEREQFLPTNVGPTSPITTSQPPFFHEYASFKRPKQIDSEYLHHTSSFPNAMSTMPQPQLMVASPPLIENLRFEPPEAAVAKPLAVISFFFCCQFCFSIPALVLAYKRNSPRATYRSSIGLSVTAIVIGVCACFGAVGTILLFVLHGDKLRELRNVLFSSETEATY